MNRSSVIPEHVAPTETDSERGSSDKEPSHRQYTDARQYALALSDRIRSFEADPLHSTAYLNYLAKYLNSPFQNQSRRPQALLAQNSLVDRQFVQQYLLNLSRPPERTAFDNPSTYFTTPIAAKNEIIFLTGRPSAEWLNAVGSRYKLDHRFFHQHLGPILANQKHWCAVPTLPSRSLDVLRLCIPSIVFIGSQGRDVDVLGLELARNDCNDQLRKGFRSLQDSSALQVGNSIIRRMQIHHGSALIIEQEITIALVQREEKWSLLVWTDAGNETDHRHIPVPSTEGFTTVASQISYCPVFFEAHLMGGRQQMADDSSMTSFVRQPLALLSSNYGTTIDWAKYPNPTPLYALREILAFEASSALQYINMLEQLLHDHLRGGKFPSYEHTKLDKILHFDYAKSVLIRLKSHFTEVLSFLSEPPLRWQSTESNTSSVDQAEAVPLLAADFRYLISRADRLVSTCDAGKATLMSNESVQESKRSAAEARLVTKLTQATNRVTFIFLPISYVTAVFGMNFVQFGQGTLSIWLWVIITLPLLIVSVIIVERGTWIKERYVRMKQ